MRSTIGPQYWEKFRNYKQRGEWVELQFMAAAAQRRFAVSKPWGDTQAYDVGIEQEQNFLRVQVKSTTTRSGAGYRCQFMPNHLKKCDYSLDQIDVFAAYVIPENAWYLIPAVLLLGKRRKNMAALCPVVPPAKKASYCYERFRENWDLLKKSRDELLEYANDQSAFVKGYASKSSRKSGVDLCGRYPVNGCPILSRSLRKGGYDERRPLGKVGARSFKNRI